MTRWREGEESAFASGGSDSDPQIPQRTVTDAEIEAFEARQGAAEGYRLVPVEATEDQLAIAHPNERDRLRLLYSAMVRLGRAPSPSTPVVSRDRPTENPGGMECVTCGAIFVGADWHAECGICHIDCPHCDGKGGGVEGYYEPEWFECPCCNEDGEGTGKVTPERLAAYNKEIADRDAWIEREMYWQGVGEYFWRWFGFCHVCQAWSLSFLLMRRCTSDDYWCKQIRAATNRGPAR